LYSISKNLSPKKSFIIYHTFVGADRICFTPGFPVKSPAFGVLSSFIHVVSPTVEVLSLSSELVVLFTWIFYSRGTIFVSLKNLYFHWRISAGTLDKLSDNNSGRIRSFLMFFFLLSNTFLLVKCYKTLAVHHDSWLTNVTETLRQTNAIPLAWDW
jgi:hypothetical protein